MNIKKQEKYLEFPLMELEKRLQTFQMGFDSYTPLLRIEDHKSAVLCCEFHPSGDYFLSGNQAGQIRIDSMSSTVLDTDAHTGAVMEAHFCRDGTNIYSCSDDETLGIWDAFVGLRIATMEGHIGTVNSVQGSATGYPVLCSGGKDGTVRIWDVREKDCVMCLESDGEVTSTLFNETGEYVFSGGQDRKISIWDLRMTDIISSLYGHTGPVTGLSLSPCGLFILSHSVDSTLRIWDVRPYTSYDRLLHCFDSNQNYVSGLLRCAWSPDGGMISAGTSSCVVQVLDAATGIKLLDLSPHEGSVNDVAFHPDELLMLSASNDNCLFLHELTK